MKIFKQIIIITLIVVCVIVLEIITNKITANAIGDISKKMEELEKNIDENHKKLNQEVDNLEKEWKEKEEKLSYYLEHDEIEKVSLNIGLLKKEIEIEEYDYAKETIAEVKYLLNHIKDKPKLKINNIF